MASQRKPQEELEATLLCRLSRQISLRGSGKVAQFVGEGPPRRVVSEMIRRAFEDLVGHLQSPRSCSKSALRRVPCWLGGL